MTGYTKLFHSILASTIWRADDQTRIVWITLLAMSDKRGLAEGSVPGLADLARVSIPDCQRALEALSAPDAWSRSRTQEGRRIEAVEGGWRLINHAKYRDLLCADERRDYLRIKQQEQRDKKKRPSTPVNTRQQPCDESTESTHTSPSPAPTSTDVPSTSVVRARSGAVPVPVRTPKTRKAPAAPASSFKVLCTLAEDVLRREVPFEDEGDFVEALKVAASKLQIPYDAQVIRKVVDAVQHARAKR